MVQEILFSPAVPLVAHTSVLVLLLWRRAVSSFLTRTCIHLIASPQHYGFFDLDITCFVLVNNLPGLSWDVVRCTYSFVVQFDAVSFEGGVWYALRRLFIVSISFDVFPDLLFLRCSLARSSASFNSFVVLSIVLMDFFLLPATFFFVLGHVSLKWCMMVFMKAPVALLTFLLLYTPSHFSVANLFLSSCILSLLTFLVYFVFVFLMASPNWHSLH